MGWTSDVVPGVPAQRGDPIPDPTRGRLRRRLRPRPSLRSVVAGAALLLLGSAAFVPDPAAGQEPVSPERAQAIRDTLSRPPAQGPLRPGDVLGFPFRLLGLPFELLVDGTAEVVGWASRPGLRRPVVRAYRSVTSVGLRPSVTTDLGGRSGPALEVGWVGLEPLRLETGWSVRGYQRHGARAELRRGGWTLRPRVGFRRLTQEPFWGIGIHTPEDGRTDYLDEGWIVEAGLRRTLGSRWSLSVGGGWQETSVGRGRDPGQPDLQDRFEPGELPGLDRTRFLLLRGGLAFDGHRVVDGWRRGLRVQGRGHLYRGVGGTSTDFAVLSGEAEAFFPVTSHEHLTLRAWTRWSGGADARIPFTHLPAVGGGETLRSYEWGRFRDRVALVGSAEWRWEVWRDLRERARVHGLLFVDHGGVAPAFSELSDTRSSVGVGVGGRWRTGIEGAAWVAFGEEGARLSGTLTTEAW